MTELSDASKNTGSEPGSKITVAPVNLAIPVPPMQLGAHVTRENFHVLMEGAGVSRDTSIRDVSIGVGATAITTAIVLVITTDLFRSVSMNSEIVRVPNWGPLLITIIFAIAGLFALLLARITHARAKGDPGRRSYCELINRLKADLQIDQESK